MAKFQVVAVKDLQGEARETKRPYHMRIASGVFTNDDGVCEIGEITFMKRDGQELPVLAVGASYTPVIGAYANKGKLEFKITELKPITAAAAVKAA